MNRFGRDLVCIEFLQKSEPKFDDQLRPHIFSKWWLFKKFKFKIKTIFISQFERNSQCIYYLPNDQLCPSFSFDGHLVSKWQPFKNSNTNKTCFYEPI